MATFSIKARPEFPNDLRVLLLEAAPERPSVIEQLQQLRFTVHAFACPHDAAAFLASESEPAVDIILAAGSLVRREEEGGAALLAAMRTAAVPLVMMAPAGCVAEVYRGLDLGAAETLEKPVGQDKLRNIWQHVVRKMMTEVAPDDRSPAVSVSLTAMAAAASLAAGSPDTTPAAEPVPGTAIPAPTAPAAPAAAVPAPVVTIKVEGGEAVSAAPMTVAPCASVSPSVSGKVTPAVASTPVTPSADASPAASADNGKAQTLHSGCAMTRQSSMLEADASSCSTETQAARPRRAGLRQDVRRVVGGCESTSRASTGNPRPFSTRQRRQRPSRGGASSGALATTPQPSSLFQMPMGLAACPAVWTSQSPGLWAGAPAGAAMPGMLPGSMGAANWQMPAAFMPIDNTGQPPSPPSPRKPKKHRSGSGSRVLAAAAPAPRTSIDSFSSAMSSAMEIDASFLESLADEPLLPPTTPREASTLSPSMYGSGDSFQSDFTDLVLPAEDGGELDLEMMLGDASSIFADDVPPSGVATPTAAPGEPSGYALPAPTAPEQPPIGLQLKKSQSLLDLINSHLATAGGGSGFPVNVAAAAAAASSALCCGKAMVC